MPENLLDRREARKAEGRKKADSKATEPDWKTPCFVCGEKPTVPCTGMCGPCTFGEAETAGGNW
jgi:hypothetical protein